MNQMLIKKFLEENYPEDQFLLLTGFDDCFLGIISECTGDSRSCYDYKKILLKLQQDGMTEDEAIEYFNFNIIGSYMGEKSPVFLNKA